MDEIVGFNEIAQQLDERDLLSTGYPFMQSVDTVRQSVDEAKMTADFVIVTRSKEVNRNGHVVQIAPDDNARGIILDNFERNPVVLFNHGFVIPFPIGRSSLPKLSKSKATAQVQFSQSNPDAAIVFGLVAEGILNTSSVSFLPIRAKPYMSPDAKRKKTQSEDEEEVVFRPYRSFDFIESDLLEWSVVDVPADADAVRKHLDRGQVGGERITQGMRRAMEQMCPEKPVVSGPGPAELRRRREAAVSQAVQESVGQAVDASFPKVMDSVRLTLESRVDKLTREIFRLTGR